MAEVSFISNTDMLIQERGETTHMFRELECAIRVEGLVKRLEESMGYHDLTVFP